jgi:thiamine kinase-like enzyme
MEKGSIIGQGREAEVIFWDNNKVLKLFREGLSLEYVDFEFKIGQLVQKHYQFAPKVFEKITHNKRQGIIYEYILGKPMNEAIISHPLNIKKFAKMFAKLHVEMHTQVVPEIRDQRDYFKRRILSDEHLTSKQKEIIIQHLKMLNKGTILCHGDFHLENVLVTENNFYVIDWSVVTAGNPNADIARTLYILKYGNDPTAIERSFWMNLIIKFFRFYFVRKYFRTYKKLKNVSLKDVKKWNLIIYAVRLGEQIQEENAFLLKEIDKEINKLTS